MNKEKICIYHGNCSDGFGAAYAVWRKFGHDNITYVKGVYGEAPPDCKDKDVIMVDFSYKRPVLIQIIKVCNTLLILDHHKTAKEDLAFLSEPPTKTYLKDEWATQSTSHNSVHNYALFDMERSGAMIAWQYFHPNKPVPFLIEAIQDRDLWKFKKCCTKEVLLFLSSFPQEFDEWDNLIKKVSKQTMIDGGKHIKRKFEKDIYDLIEQYQTKRSINGYVVPCANLPYMYSSDVCNIMAVDQPFAAVYSITAKRVVFSLRSAPDGLDVSEIAKNFGGGGHKHAAGFEISFEEFQKFAI